MIWIEGKPFLFVDFCSLCQDSPWTVTVMYVKMLEELQHTANLTLRAKATSISHIQHLWILVSTYEQAVEYVTIHSVCIWHVFSNFKLCSITNKNALDLLIWTEISTFIRASIWKYFKLRNNREHLLHLSVHIWHGWDCKEASGHKIHHGSPSHFYRNY
jgi:uncharacterized membrane protein